MRSINTFFLKNRIFSARFWKSILGFKQTEESEPAASKEPKYTQEVKQAQQRAGRNQKAGEINKEIVKRSLVRSELNLEKNAIFTVSTYRGKSRTIELPPEKGPNGEVAKRTVIVGKTGKGIETGILTTNHFKIHLVLIELWEKAGKPTQEPVHFTTYKIIKRLDLQDDGRTYKRVKQSLYDLRQIPIEFIHSFYVPKEGDFSTLEPFTILNHLRIYERKKVGKQQRTRGYGEFQFDRYILENLVNNHVHPLRLDIVKSFQKHKDMAVLLYTYVDRNLAFKDKFEIKLERLFDNLDLSQSYVRYPAERKRVLDPVLDQLRGKELSTGVLSYAQVLKTKDGKDYKLVCRKKPFPKRLREQEVPPQPQLAPPTELAEPEVPESTEAESESVGPEAELVTLLEEKGLTGKQVLRILAENDSETISNQLDYLPFRLEEYKAQGREINEPAILYDSIKQNWKVPKGYLKAEKEREREAERLERERIARLEQEERDRAKQERLELEAYKESLPPGERARLRERALEEVRSMEGVREDFINEVLITVKENEIVRSHMEESKS